MAERPRILRSLRALDAAALAVAALTLATAPAQAAVSVFAVGYADAGLDGPLLALHRPGGQGEIRGPEGTRTLPGNHPAIGGGRAAYRPRRDRSRSRAGQRSRRPAPTRVAVSATWVAWRTAGAIHAAPLDETPVPRQIVAGNVGRPGAARQPARVRRSTAGSSPSTSTPACAPLLRREARARAARAVGLRLPPDLHQGDLQAPAGPDRRRCSRGGRPRTARSTAPRRPPDATPATSRAATPPGATSTSRSGGGRPRASRTR